LVAPRIDDSREEGHVEADEHMELTREITLPATAEEVWRSLEEPAWLGEDASIELQPDGEVRAGDRTGFVEEVEEERRLVFWWAAPDEDSTRVELSLEEDGDVTHVRVVESRPLAMLDLFGAEIVTSAPRFRQPEMLAR
jgi:uncharacterized protein YndB with AHSA1/START domain